MPHRRTAQYAGSMETTSRDIRDLRPDERQAAETLLGRSLVDFQKIVIRELDGGHDVIIRFLGREGNDAAVPPAGKWAVPACFNVLTDLSDEQRVEFDAVVSAPAKLY